MSYILDALRKSEEKRSSLDMPVTSGHYNQPQDKKDHRIQWLLIALFIAAGSGWFMTSSPQLEIMPATIGHSPPVEPKTFIAKTIPRKPLQMAAPQTNEPLQMTVSQTTEPAEQPEKILRVRKPDAQQAKANPVHITPSTPERKTTLPDPVKVELSSIPPSLLTDDHEPATATAHIPDRSELTLTQQQVLPAISIAGHIYGETPSERMVIINSKVRREKQHIGDGLTLEEITAKGVILNHRGTIFRMGVFD